MQNPIRTPLLLVSVLTLFGTAVSGLKDGNTGPQGIVPSPSALVAGGTTTLQITLNEASSTNTVIDLSSSSTYFAVPTTLTIPAGEIVGYTTGVSSASEPSEAPVVTAYANGLQAQARLMVTQTTKVSH